MTTDNNTTLQHGDALALMKQIPSESIDSIITDPPYGLFDEDWDRPVKLTWIYEAARLLKPSGAFYCFWSCMKIPELQQFVEGCLKLRNIIVWHYANSWRKRSDDQYSTTWEAVFYAVKDKGKPFKREEFSKAAQDVQIIAIPQSNFLGSKEKKHPFQKPVELLEIFVRNSTNEGQVVLDPFMGSGATGIAALRNDRKFIGIEKDKDFFELAKKRIENYTTLELWARQGILPFAETTGTESSAEKKDDASV